MSRKRTYEFPEGDIASASAAGRARTETAMARRVTKSLVASILLGCLLKRWGNGW